MNEPVARSLIRKTAFDLIFWMYVFRKGTEYPFWNGSARKGRKGIPFIITTEYMSVSDVIRTIKLGAIDYLPKPVRKEHLLRLAIRHIPTDGHGTEAGEGVVSPDKPENSASGEICQTGGPSEMSVMVLGANSTGKESMVQSIHQGSKCRDMPFVTVNCGTLPRELVASLFFGHAKGAVTNADTAAGNFDMAKGGTLFLDEVGAYFTRFSPCSFACCRKIPIPR